MKRRKKNLEFKLKKLRSKVFCLSRRLNIERQRDNNKRQKRRLRDNNKRQNWRPRDNTRKVKRSRNTSRKKNRNRSMRRVKKLKRVKRNMKRNRNKNMKKNNNMRKEMNSNHRNMRKKDNMKKDNLRKDNLIWPTDNTKYITKTKLSNYPPTHQIMIKEPPYKSQILNKLRNHL